MIELPVRVLVVDGKVPPIDCQVPPAGDASWEVEYGDPCESGKRTSRTSRIGRQAMTVISDPLFAIDIGRRLNLTALPDPTVWGGGLHVMPPGSGLGTHLDGDRHPLLPQWRRAVAVVAFVHPEWQKEWGGRLYFTDPDGNAVRWIDPKPGRVVAWEMSDLAYHGVEEVTGPVERVSVATFYLSPADDRNTRTRALFLPVRKKPAAT